MAKHPLQIMNLLGDAAHKKMNPPNPEAEDNEGLVSTSKQAANKKLSGKQVAAVKAKKKGQADNSGNAEYPEVAPKKPKVTATENY